MNDMTGWKKITPKQATALLNANTSNRTLRPGVVERYARDMTNGNWTRNPQPIIFYDDGELADGQHRLWAVVESGKAIDFFVQYDIPRSTALNLDTGINRDLMDNARIGKYEGYITKQAIGTAIFMHFGERKGSKPLTNSERLSLVQMYTTHLEFADRQMPAKKVVSAMPIRAAVARAHMHLGDNARLAEFCKILGTGLPEDAEGDRAVLAFRNYLLDITINRKTDPRDIFLKAQNAIWYFMKHKPLKVVKVIKDEAYPLIEKK